MLLGVLLLISHAISPERMELVGNDTISFWPWAEKESKITSHSFSKSEIQCKYVLHESSPYAGFTLNPNISEFWDISKFKYVEIEIDSKNCSPFQFSLSYFIDGFSDSNRWQSLRMTLFPIYTVDKKRHQLAIRDIHTPTWWFRENNIQAKDIAPIDYRKLANIGVTNGENQQIDNEGTITVTSITFIGEEYISSSLITALILIYSSALALLFIYRKKRVGLPKMHKVALTSYADEEYERVASYMGEHFSRKNLTAGIVAEQTGVSTSKITHLLHSYRGQNYSQFLNTLRLEEAKRLLRETDRNVSEISSHVGYGYVNSFNRVFKEFEAKTPLEYRSTQQSKEKKPVT